MSGCQPANTDPCNCACHVLGQYKFPNCCKCFQIQICKHGMVKSICHTCIAQSQEQSILEKPIKKCENKISEYKSVMPKIDIPDFILNQVSDLNEEVRSISDWMMDKQEKIKFLDQQLDQCIGEIGELKRKKAEVELVAHHYIDVNKKLDKLEEFKKQYFDQFEKTHAWITEIERRMNCNSNTIGIVDSVYDESIVNIEKRLDKLESEDEMRNHAYQVLEKRIIELESMKDDFYTVIKNNAQNEVKIEKLESSKLSQELDPKVWVFMKEQIDKLEKQILETRIQFIDNIGNEKKPYRCPVCNGKGSESTPDTIRFDILMCEKNSGMSTCHSCEGKGILWG